MYESKLKRNVAVQPMASCYDCTGSCKEDCGTSTKQEACSDCFGTCKGDCSYTCKGGCSDTCGYRCDQSCAIQCMSGEGFSSLPDVLA